MADRVQKTLWRGSLKDGLYEFRKAHKHCGHIAAWVGRLNDSDAWLRHWDDDRIKLKVLKIEKEMSNVRKVPKPIVQCVVEVPEDVETPARESVYDQKSTVLKVFEVPEDVETFARESMKVVEVPDDVETLVHESVYNQKSTATLSKEDVPEEVETLARESVHNQKSTATLTQEDLEAILVSEMMKAMKAN